MSLGLGRGTRGRERTPFWRREVSMVWMEKVSVTTAAVGLRAGGEREG